MSSGSIVFVCDIVAPLSVVFTRRTVMASSRGRAEESRRATGNSRASCRDFGGLAGEEVALEGVGRRLEAPGEHGHGGLCGRPATRVREAEDDINFLLREERETDQEGQPVFRVRGVYLGGGSPELVDKALELMVALLDGRPFRLRDMSSTREERPKAEFVQPLIQFALGTDALSTALRHEAEDFCADLTQDQLVPVHTFLMHLTSARVEVLLPLPLLLVWEPGGGEVQEAEVDPVVRQGGVAAPKVVVVPAPMRRVEI